MTARGQQEPIQYGLAGPHHAPKWGTNYKTALREQANRRMIISNFVTQLPLESNRVDLDSHLKDASGLPAMRITMTGHPDDFKCMEFFKQKSVEILRKQLWPNQRPIGRHLKLSFYPDKDREVVGVVGDVKQIGLDTSAGMATLYWPLAQVTGAETAPWRARPLSLAVRTTTPPQTLAAALTGAIHQVNKEIPVDNVMTLEDFVGETLTPHSFNMQLLAIFGLLALVLCAVGIYSVLAYSVKRSMREIGLRIALGATLRDIGRLVIVQGMKPTLAGIGIGLVAALALGRVATSLIYGVSSRDLVTFLAVTMLLILVSFGASLVPALRATRVDPLTVLRDE